MIGVSYTDCRSEDGVTVGLIDGLIATCRVLASRNLSSASVREALRDLRNDSHVIQVTARTPLDLESPFSDWLSTKSDTSDAAAETAVLHLYANYLRWASAQGLESPLGQTSFRRALSERGFRKIKRDGAVYVGGVRLIGPPP